MIQGGIPRFFRISSSPCTGSRRKQGCFSSISSGLAGKCKANGAKVNRDHVKMASSPVRTRLFLITRVRTAIKISCCSGGT